MISCKYLMPCGYCDEKKQFCTLIASRMEFEKQEEDGVQDCKRRILNEQIRIGNDDECTPGDGV